MRALARVTDNRPDVPEHEGAVLEAERETPPIRGSGVGRWIVDESGRELGFESTERGTDVTIRSELGERVALVTVSRPLRPV